MSSDFLSSIENMIPGNCLTQADEIVDKSNSSSGALGCSGVERLPTAGVSVTLGLDWESKLFELQDVNKRQSISEANLR